MKLNEHINIAHKGVDKSRFTMRLYRYISKYISYILIRLNISPNQVTIFHNIAELSSLFLFLSGNYNLYYLTIFILFLGGILDNVDGEIARVTKNTSLKGEYLDLIGHRIIHPMFFLFLTVGVYKNNLEISLLVAGAICALGYTISEVATNVYKQILFDKNQKVSADNIITKKHRLFSLRWWDYSIFCFDHIKFFLVIALILQNPGLLIYLYSALFVLRAIAAVSIKYKLLSF